MRRPRDGGRGGRGMERAGRECAVPLKDTGQINLNGEHSHLILCICNLRQGIALSDPTSFPSCVLCMLMFCSLRVMLNDLALTSRVFSFELIGIQYLYYYATSHHECDKHLVYSFFTIR